MIETTTVSGRPAQVAYINAKFEPVDVDDAVLIKVLFTDALGGSVFLVNQTDDNVRDADIIDINTQHEPSGSPKGGQFAKAAFDELPDLSKISGPPFTPWTPPQTDADWADVDGQNPGIDEPPLPETTKTHSYKDPLTGETKTYTVKQRLSSGVIMREADGRAWIVKPTGGFGGYNYTFPKGGVEEGLSPQANAIKETYEETGLKARITGYAGDYRGDTGTTRMYYAMRETGHPADHGWETEAVALVHAPEAFEKLNRSRDKKIAFHHLMKKHVKDAWLFDKFDESKHPRHPKGSGDKGGEFAPKGASLAEKHAAMSEEIEAGKHGSKFGDWKYGSPHMFVANKIKVDEDEMHAMAAKHGMKLTEHGAQSQDPDKTVTMWKAEHADKTIAQITGKKTGIENDTEGNTLAKVLEKKGIQVDYYSPNETGGEHQFVVPKRQEFEAIEQLDKFGYKFKVASGMDQDYVTLKIASEAAPTVTPEPAAIDVKDLVKIAGKKGSNEGGVYENTSGEKFYVKLPKTKDHVQNETMAAKLYQLAGARTMEYVPSKDGNAVITKLQKLDKDNISKFNADERHEAQKDFGIHAWLSNWDAAGTGGDNQVVIGGHTHTVDTGGSMKYRAMGTPKGSDYGNKVTDTKSIIDPKLNKDGFYLYGNMTNAQKIESYKRVTEIPDQAIIDTVHGAGGSWEDAEKLLMRKKDLADQQKGLEAIEKMYAATAAAQAEPQATMAEQWDKKYPKKPEMSAEEAFITPLTPKPASIPVFKTKSEHQKYLLEKGTTIPEMLTAMGWNTVSMPQTAHNANMKLTKIKGDDGVTYYKGTPMTPEEIKNKGKKPAPTYNTKATKAETDAMKAGGAAPSPDDKMAAVAKEIDEAYAKAGLPNPTVSAPGYDDAKNRAAFYEAIAAAKTKTPDAFHKELSAQGVAHGDMGDDHTDPNHWKISAPVASAQGMAAVAKNHPEWTLKPGMKTTYTAPKSAFTTYGKEFDEALAKEVAAKIAPAVAAQKTVDAFKKELDEAAVNYEHIEGKLYHHITPEKVNASFVKNYIASKHPGVIDNNDGSFSVVKQDAVKQAVAPKTYDINKPSDVFESMLFAEGVKWGSSVDTTGTLFNIMSHHDLVETAAKYHPDAQKLGKFEYYVPHKKDWAKPEPAPTPAPSTLDLSTPHGAFMAALEAKGVHISGVKGTWNNESGHTIHIDYGKTAAKAVAQHHPLAKQIDDYTYFVPDPGVDTPKPEPLLKGPIGYTPPVTEPPTEAELNKAKKNVKLQAQYVPGMPAGHPEAEKLLAAFNVKYEGKTITDPNELAIKVADFKKLQASMIPFMNEQQKKEAIAKAEHAKKLAVAAQEQAEADKAAKEAAEAEHQAKLSDPAYVQQQAVFKQHMDVLKSIGKGSYNVKQNTQLAKSYGWNVNPEQMAFIRAYIGNAYNELNDQWRSSVLDDAQFGYGAALDDALDAMPKHTGYVQRGIRDKGLADREKIFDSYAKAVGKIKREHQFTSGGKKHKLWGEITIHIQNSFTGADFSKANMEGGGEIVFGLDTPFKILKVDKKTWTIWMEEVKNPYAKKS